MVVAWVTKSILLLPLSRVSLPLIYYAVHYQGGTQWAISIQTGTTDLQFQAADYYVQLIVGYSTSSVSGECLSITVQNKEKSDEDNCETHSYSGHSPYTDTSLVFCSLVSPFSFVHLTRVLTGYGE